MGWGWGGETKFNLKQQMTGLLQKTKNKNKKTNKQKTTTSESNLLLASLKYFSIFKSTLLKPQLCVATYTAGSFVDVNLIFHCKTVFRFCRFELNVINSSCISNVHFCSKNFFIWEKRGAGSAGANQICSDKNCSPFLTRTIADQEICNMATKPVARTFLHQPDWQN